MFKLKRIIFYVALLAALLIAGISIRQAEAHARVEVGPYVIIVGWVEEPVIVGERNALLLDIKRDQSPVTGLEGSLEVTVLYAGKTYLGNIAPTAEPGVYTVEIFPTVRGQYTVHLTGNIEELPVDELIEPEEVLGPAALQFPEAEPDTFALEQRVNELETNLKTARWLAIGGLIVAGLALLVNILGKLRK